ncbi:hypothetical protein N8T08_003230 [Aspergillus melleus]|uniref:Uncharacterized protein n=1 Tax=Aspergillus melleus TaxID=138277 RepID=A0ACC3B6R9_9EURO|nr:hypothetical protein N8T08_003230 [Aspergillus melleus]
MVAILSSPRYLARFRDFLTEERPPSIPTLTHYLNACKALKAIQYANALVRLSIDVPTAGIKQSSPIGIVESLALEKRVQDALIALTADELPAFITANCINITSKVVEKRIRGTLPGRFRGTADALAKVFCLTDPSRPDSPIIFASEEFYRTTQYDSSDREDGSDKYRREAKSEFQELGELFSPKELRNVDEHGGSLFQPVLDAGGAPG